MTHNALAAPASSPVAADAVRATVRDQYAAVARTPAATSSACCAPGCCTPGGNPTASLALGYDAADLAAVPEGANMGLGCGNPQAMAQLQPGETVLDLGSGGGFDCVLAAQRVGPTGQVIGVDMTPDMVSKARANAVVAKTSNVSFRLGEIEHLPVADHSVDVIMSNCVINLSPDKAAVFADAFRVLKAGGRLAISDVVATGDLPEALRRDVTAVVGCIGGAAPVTELQQLLASAGFVDVVVDVDEASRAVIADWLPGSGAERYVASAKIAARKPVASAATTTATKAKPRVPLSALTTFAPAADACCAPGCCEDT